MHAKILLEQHGVFDIYIEKLIVQKQAKPFLSTFLLFQTHFGII